MKHDWNDPLKKAVEAGSVERARSAIITHIDDDSRNERMIALEIADEVSKILPNLYEDDSGRLEVPDIEEWSRIFWNRIKAALGLNFSRAKIELATKVAKYLRSRGEADFQTIEPRQPERTREHHAENGEDRPRTCIKGSGDCSPRAGVGGKKDARGKKSLWIPVLITVGALVAACVAVCCLKKV